MRQFRLWNTRYIYDRVALMVYEKHHPSVPWLTQEMINILEGWLTSGDRGIEWGSGRSTVWFAERVGSVVSFEHNPTWFQRIDLQLKQKGLQNVAYRLCEEEGNMSVSQKNFFHKALIFV